MGERAKSAARDAPMGREKRVSGFAPARRARAAEPGGDVATLVVRAREGDRWAKDALFRAHVVPITRLVTRLLARTADADDVVQDTFAIAFEDLHALREPERFEAWLHRIALNRVRKRFRRRKLSRLLGLDSGIDDASLTLLADPSASPEDLAELRRVERLLASVPTEARIAWMLRHVEGETLERVAELTSVSLATAKRRVETARVIVQAAIERGRA